MISIFGNDDDSIQSTPAGKKRSGGGKVEGTGIVFGNQDRRLIFA